MWESYDGPDRTGLNEKEVLTGWLRYHAVYLLGKIDDLNDEEWRRIQTPSGVSLLGIVKHMAYVYRWWFPTVMLGEDSEFPWSTDDPDADWRIEPSETAEEVVATYKFEVERCYDILDSVELDEERSVGDRSMSLRWIVSHMVEEAAQHNGHADILRENIDGSVSS